MARSKQGAVVRRGKLLYARIRWQEWEEGKRVQREKLERVRTISEGRERCKQLLRELEDAGAAVLDADRLTFAQLGARYQELNDRKCSKPWDSKMLMKTSRKRMTMRRIR